MATLALTPTRPRIAPKEAVETTRVLWTVDAGPARSGELTLDDHVSGVWRDLSASTAASCPICAADMVARWSAGAGVVGGRCGSCGCTLE